MKRPTAQQQKYFKDFKAQVRKEAEYSFSMPRYPGHRVMIGNMDCLFYPLHQTAVDNALKTFKTTVWWKK